MSFAEQLDISLRARLTLMILMTVEEERALDIIEKVCEHNQRGCITWDAAEGFTTLVGHATAGQAKDALTALERIDHLARETRTDSAHDYRLQESGASDRHPDHQLDRLPARGMLFVLRDFHECWNNLQVKRKLKNLAQRLRRSRHSLLITMPGSGTPNQSTQIPQELKNEAVVLDFPLPTAAELEEVLQPLTETPGVQVQLTPLGREKLVQAALGLTAAQAQRIFAEAVVRDGKLDERDISLVTEAKRQLIRENEALEFFSATETPENVGGLEVLKEWLRLRERAFTREARAYGLPAPKGIALIGIPGTGKSLTAKMIGSLWRLPLLRLDVGALYGSLVGQSEERTRRVLRLAETMAPCILWIDEMEKGLATNSLDGGTSQRVFGSILTWMQEKTVPCFIVATANDITALPPELLRKGRFDEIFFLDLPTLHERQEIFRVHLSKRGRLPADFQIEPLAAAAEGYVGAEIEQAIIEAMFQGFNEHREFTTADILQELKRLVPLSVSQREIVSALRRWLHEGRAQSASRREPEATRSAHATRSATKTTGTAASTSIGANSVRAPKTSPGSDSGTPTSKGAGNDAGLNKGASSHRPTNAVATNPPVNKSLLPPEIAKLLDEPDASESPEKSGLGESPGGQLS